MATDDIEPLVLAIDRLGRLSFPSDLSFDRKGNALAAAIRPSAREAGESYQSRIWRFMLDGTATQITHGPNSDFLPRYSPVDERLAFASDRTVRGRPTSSSWTTAR